MELAISGVGKEYRGGFWGLKDFDLTLRPGILGLLGPNGAGKSTLMRILATVTKPTEGTVTWDGADIAGSPNDLRAVLGYLPQSFGVYPNLNAIEFLEYMAATKGLAGKAARRRIDELLELLNLTEAAKSQGFLLDIALGHLSLGRAQLLEMLQENGDFPRTAEHLDQAVDGLRQAGQQDELPRGLLARAVLHRVRGDFAAAQRDLDETMSIAQRGGMRLHEADAHLEYARLHLAMGETDEARERLATAKTMIDDMGYHRRDPEVEDLADKLTNA